MLKNIIAGLVYNIFWFAIIYLGSIGEDLWTLPLAVFYLLINHFYFVQFSPARLKFYIVIFLSGLLMESYFIWAEILVIQKSAFAIALWPVSMWMIFPLNFFHCFNFVTQLKYRYQMTCSLGAIGAAFFYWRGSLLGIIGLEKDSLLQISLGWFLFSGLILFTYDKFNRGALREHY